MEVVGSNSLPEADWASFFKLNNEPYDSSKLSSLALRLGNDRSNYSNMELAGRILIYDIVRTSGNNIERYVRTFSRRLSPKISEFYLEHAERLSAELKARESKNYENYDYFSAFTRIRSYLLRPTYGEESRETPEQSLLRTAVQLYHDQGVERVLQCYREMSDRWYIHASPTQFNAGTKVPQLSSCFVAGTEVCTLNGPKPIEEVQIGDYVVTHTGKTQKVLQIHKNLLGERNLVDLKCWKTPNITVTEDHKVWATTVKSSPEWIPVSSLTKDYYISIPGKKIGNEEPSFDLANFITSFQRNDHVEYKFEITQDKIYATSLFSMKDHLNGTDHIITRSRKHSYPVNRFLKITYDVAIALGMWFGDGCVRHKRDTMNKEQQITGISLVCHEGNPGLYKFWARIMEEFTGVPPKIYFKEKLFYVEFGSTLIGYFFNHLFGSKFDGKRLHSSIFQWSPELVKAFMIGLVSTDGCFGKGQNNMVIGMNNPALLKQVYHLCRQSGQDVSFAIGSALRKGATMPTAQMVLPNGWIKPTELFKHYDDGRLEKSCSFRISAHHVLEKDGRKFVRVKSVTPSQVERPTHVYTLGVEGDHSYNVEGIVVQNCFLIQIADDLKAILKTGVYEVGEISKMNGGIGYNVSRLRDSEIGDVGHSADILGHLRIYDATIKDVNQGGKRDGAATIFLRPHHKNIRSFVRSTDNYTNHELRLGKVNTCLWMSRLFFKRVEKKEKWTVFCPAKTPSLNGLYGYDFEIEYCRLEKEALLREEEFQEAKKAYDELKVEYLRNPENLELEKRLDEALEKKIQSKKRRINHEVLDASELYDEICSVQMRSGMPYICHGDAGNDKSNQKNIGTIDGSNLCLEIFEVSTPDSIASCNLVSLNMVTPVKGALPFPGKISEIATPEGNKDTVITEVVANPSDLRDVYDFNLLGKASQSGIFNIEEVIDKNFYPLDKHDAEGNVLKRGKISRPNFDNRPIGMGISGFDDALKKMNLGVSDVRAELFNKMAFACIYFNALVASLKLAIERGPYPNFRTGSYKKYLGTVLNEEGKKIPLYEMKEGSPLANGQFQFDLWAETAQQLYDMGDLDLRVYDRNDDIPIEPSTWGQEPIIIEHGQINLVIEPTWDSLRQAILEHGVRNSLLIALMPTASTAHILRNAESTEGHQGNIYVKEGKDWSCTVIVRWLVDDLNSLCAQLGLGEIKLWNQNLADFIAACHGTVKYIKNFMTDFPQYFPSEIFDNGKLKEEVSKGLDWIVFKYKTIYEVSQKVHIRYARQRGIYICQSQSLNIYLEAPTQKQLRALHSYTNKMGIKTGMYYLRQSEATKIAKLTLDPEIAKYHRNLMEKMGIHHLSNVAEARQEETPAPVCRREAGCVSCN